MNVYTIHIERISTGEVAPTLLHRCETEDQARAYAEPLIARDADLRVAEITGRRG